MQKRADLGVNYLDLTSVAKAGCARCHHTNVESLFNAHTLLRLLSLKLSFARLSGYLSYSFFNSTHLLVVFFWFFRASPTFSSGILRSHSAQPRAVMDEFKREASDEPRDRSRDRRHDRTRDSRRDRSSERNSGQSGNERNTKRDSASAREKASDPYWYPGKGKFSHLNKMPTQNPHDPRPRNPKRTHSCRSEPSGQRHARLERKHDRREEEREALKNGALSTFISPSIFRVVYKTNG